MDEPFISRTFLIGNREVVCSFSRPRPDGNDFKCVYKIAFPERDHVSYAYGIDGVQALVLATQKAHMDLLASEEYQRRNLNWHGMRDLGLPLPPGVTTDDFSNPPSKGG